MNRLVHTLLSVTLLITFVNCYAADINTLVWPTYQHNASHDGFVDIALNPQFIKPDWQIDVGTQNGEQSLISAISSDKYIYVLSVSYSGIDTFTLYCYSILDGHKIWEKSFKPDVYSMPKFNVSSPAYSNGKIYLQFSYTTNGTKFIALNADNGTNVYNTNIEWGGNSALSPTPFNGTIYSNAGEGTSEVYAINETSGKVKWTNGYTNTDYIPTTPSINDKYIVTYVNNMLEVFDSQGNLLGTNSNPNYYTDLNPYAPVLTSNGIAFITHSTTLDAYDIKTQKLNWSDNSGIYSGQPAYDGKYIYASKDGALVCVDQAGEKIWSWSKQNEKVQGQFVVTNNLILLSTEKNTYAISKETHKEIWGNPGASEIILAKGHMFLLQKPNILISFKVSAV